MSAIRPSYGPVGQPHVWHYESLPDTCPTVAIDALVPHSSGLTLLPAHLGALDAGDQRAQGGDVTTAPPPPPLARWPARCEDIRPGLGQRRLPKSSRITPRSSSRTRVAAVHRTIRRSACATATSISATSASVASPRRSRVATTPSASLA